MLRASTRRRHFSSEAATPATRRPSPGTSGKAAMDLSPARPARTWREASPPTDRARLEISARSARLVRAAANFLDHAHDSIATAPHYLVLADPEGVLLHVRTGPDLPAPADRCNLLEGASWHERDMGCNAVGTCLAQGRAVIVTGPEQRLPEYETWTGVGVPLRNPGGAIAGVLALGVPATAASAHTWGWMQSLALGIEGALHRPESRMSRLYEEAQAALRERDNVLAVVSHDLRNPLSTIAMASSLLLESISEERKQLQAAIIRRAVDHMTRLMQDLLDVARIDGGGLKVLAEPCGAADLVHSTVEVLTPLAESRAVTLSADVRTDAVVRADRDRILQVFSNLISNAATHTPEGGRVTVVAEREGSAVRFDVSDTGCGIDPAHLEHLFDRYWQARASGRAGAGLGLVIAKGIVEAHGGRITVRTALGEGTTFTFTIPLQVDS
jgi:signal transduction histidine kinase